MRAALLVVAAVLGGAIAIATAEIEGGTFSSETHNVRVTLPRGWRISDQPTYPGVILRMFKTRPRLSMLLAVDRLDDLRAGIDADCRTRGSSVDRAVQTPATLPMQLACAQSRRLAELGFEVGPIKEAARPWFDYAGKTRQLRQGVVVLGDNVFTLVLAADTAAGRAQYARTFDKALRSIRVLEAIEESDATELGELVIDAAPADGGAPAVPPDSGAPAVPPDAGAAP